MISLTWADGKGNIDTGTLSGPIAAAPVFSFKYDALYFEPLDGNIFYSVGVTRNTLTSKQATEVSQYIASFTGGNLLVEGVDYNGMYVGFAAKSSIKEETSARPPTDGFYVYDFNAKTYSYIQGVDATGAYLGNVTITACTKDVKIAPPRLDIPMLWDFTNNVWVDKRAPADIAADELGRAKSKYSAAVQAHLDDVAKTKGYDDIVSACSYAGASNPFQAEGIAFITWRGNVWDYCYKQFAAVEAGTIPMPTIVDLLLALPAAPV